MYETKFTLCIFVLFLFVTNAFAQSRTSTKIGFSKDSLAISEIENQQRDIVDFYKLLVKRKANDC